jgi:AcrR family transcriptional regulator
VTDEDGAEPAGLRERKKELTRQRISAVATRLFLERGFDRVTVAEVARAADVSTKTVFNYFPRKEDLYFDRGPQAKALISQALDRRAPDETTLRALRTLAVRQAESRHPLGRISAGDRPFWRTAAESPTLRARLRELATEAEADLAEAIAQAEGAAPDAAWPRVKAAATIAALRAVYGGALARIMAGEPEAAVEADYLRDLRRAFDALERGFDSAAS